VPTPNPAEMSYYQAKADSVNAARAEPGYDFTGLAAKSLEMYDHVYVPGVPLTADDIQHSFEYIDLSISDHYTQWGKDEGIHLTNDVFTEFANGGCTGNADPISQSIVIDRDASLTSVEVFFKSIPVDETEKFFLEVGYMGNGYPDPTTVFYNQEFSPSDVTGISDDGSIGTILEFSKKIFVPKGRQIFLTLGSGSLFYEVFISDVGYKDLVTEKIIYVNPYLEGQLFSSSNNFTWTASQTKNLTFKLNRGDFETTGNLVTENLTGLSISSFVLTCVNFNPTMGFLHFFYSINNGGTWIDFNINSFASIGTAASQLKIKIEYKGDGLCSPEVDLNSFAVQLNKFDTGVTGEYISKSVTSVPEFNSIKVVYDLYKPVGTSETPKASIDNVLWFPLNDDTGIIEFVDGYFTRWIYSELLSDYTVIDYTSITGTVTLGETLTGDTSSNTATLIDYDDASKTFLVKDKSGVFTTDTNLDGATGSIDTVSGENDYSTSTQFKGRMSMDTNFINSSPVIKKLKWIMKSI